MSDPFARERQIARQRNRPHIMPYQGIWRIINPSPDYDMVDATFAGACAFAAKYPPEMCPGMGMWPEDVLRKMRPWSPDYDPKFFPKMSYTPFGPMLDKRLAA
jgi:hypothetical protein